MTGANDRTGVGIGRGDWRTPPELFERLNRMFRFDYDAFASHENALCDTYSTTSGTFQRPLRQSQCDRGVHGFYRLDGHEEISPQDGLHWLPPAGLRPGTRRFGNPPFSRGIVGSAAMWFAQTVNDFDVSVLLLPDARDTIWWHDWVRPYATDYPIGRVHFIHPDGPCGSARCADRHEFGKPGRDTPGGSVIAVYLPDWLNGGGAA